jgi:hypothetical protein
MKFTYKEKFYRKEVDNDVYRRALRITTPLGKNKLKL